MPRNMRDFSFTSPHCVRFCLFVIAVAKYLKQLKGRNQLWVTAFFGGLSGIPDSHWFWIHSEGKYHGNGAGARGCSSPGEQEAEKEKDCDLVSFYCQLDTYESLLFKRKKKKQTKRLDQIG